MLGFLDEQELVVGGSLNRGIGEQQNGFLGIAEVTGFVLPGRSYGIS
jgi:hypothetical protein